MLGDKPLCVMLSAADALGGNTARYDGSLFDSAADFVAVDFRKSAQRDGFAYGEKHIPPKPPMKSSGYGLYTALKLKA